MTPRFRGKYFMTKSARRDCANAPDKSENFVTKTRTGRRPPIHMIDTEAEKLSDLALAVEDRLPEVSALLLSEIGRAVLHSAARIGPDVVTMHSTVTFSDESRSREYSCELVYPKDADINADRLSILTPVGAGLIGLREGQSISWPDRDGRKRNLSILKVQQQAKAA